MRYPLRESSIVGGLWMLQRDSLALALAFVLLTLSVCACSGQSVGNSATRHAKRRDWARRYIAAENGTLNQELAREDLERKHGRLAAAVNQACPGDKATERACEAAGKADPACQQMAKQEARWEMQGGKDPVADPAADSLFARCDQALQQHCGFSPLQCEEAKSALKGFETRLENAEMEQAFRPAPQSGVTIHESSASPSMQHTDCQPWLDGFSCDTMQGP